MSCATPITRLHRRCARRECRADFSQRHGGYRPPAGSRFHRCDTALLDRTVAFFLCSPANPQGAVADAAYVRRALDLARRHDFMLFFDECYSEIYANEPPRGTRGGGRDAGAVPQPDRLQLAVEAVEPARATSGFCAGDAGFMETFAEIRNLVAPQVPGPTQHLSAAVWAEEQHVAVNRQAYRAKYDVCDGVLGQRYGYRRPAGGFFLWLDFQFGGGEAATLTLWKRCGVKVVPGAYLAQPGADGINPGANYVRVALVHDVNHIREALGRIVSVLS